MDLRADQQSTTCARVFPVSSPAESCKQGQAHVFMVAVVIMSGRRMSGVAVKRTVALLDQPPGPSRRLRPAENVEQLDVIHPFPTDRYRRAPTALRPALEGKPSLSQFSRKRGALLGLASPFGGAPPHCPPIRSHAALGKRGMHVPHFPHDAARIHDFPMGHRL